MVLGLVGSRRMKPFSSSAERWECTEDVDFKWTASQISRTAGGYPFLSIVSFMYSNISCCLEVIFILSHIQPPAFSILIVTYVRVKCKPLFVFLPETH